MNIAEAKKQIEEYGIVIEPGLVYNVYECGHIYESSGDNQKTAHDPITKTRQRCCNNDLCKKKTPSGNIKRLQIKYKICACGYEQTSLHLQKSKKCHKCKKIESIKKNGVKDVTIFKKEDMQVFREPKAALTLSQALIRGVVCIPAKIYLVSMQHLGFKNVKNNYNKLRARQNILPFFY